MIFSRSLTCSIVVRLSSYIAPTSSSFGAMDGFTVGTYYGSDIGSPEESTERTTGKNFYGLFLGEWIGSLDGIEIGTNVVNELGLSDGKVLGRTLGALFGL